MPYRDLAVLSDPPAQETHAQRSRSRSHQALADVRKLTQERWLERGRALVDRQVKLGQFQALIPSGLNTFETEQEGQLMVEAAQADGYVATLDYTKYTRPAKAYIKVSWDRDPIDVG